MSDQEIHLQTHTGLDGVVHLDMDILTGMIDRDIQLTVSYKISAPDASPENDLQKILANAKPASDLGQYAGTITLTEAPSFFRNVSNDGYNAP
jgi:hypothetical protein